MGTLREIVFLGVCRRAAWHAGSLDVVGLTNVVAAPFFPLRLGAWIYVLGVDSDVLNDASGGPLRIEFRDLSKPHDACWMNLTLECSPAADSDRVFRRVVPCPNGETQAGRLPFHIPQGTGTCLSVLPLPTPDMLVLQPTLIEVTLQDAARRDTLGRVQFIFSPSPPLSDDERRAIAGRPGATRLIEMALSCPQCKAEAHYYSLLETAPPPARLVKTASDIRMAPDVWSCGCGARQIPLTYAKQGIHQLFREVAPQLDSGLDLSPIYEAGEIRSIADEYAELLRGEPEEEVMQEFLETHPISWAFLSPTRILHKPPILAKHKADFGILTTTRELVLVEIEKPSTRLLTKSRGISAAIQRGAEQIRDWDSVIVTHRAAVLSQLSLTEPEVHNIRYLLIGGMCSAADPRGVLKLRRTQLAPSTLFMGFDELGFYLQTLACTVAGI